MTERNKKGNDAKERDNSNNYLGVSFGQDQSQKNIGYNCPSCSSVIEILSINENENKIQFKCVNNKEHNNILNISNYLEEMDKYKDIKNLNDICQIHDNKKYISFCLTCKCHICEECIKSKLHKNHDKIYLGEEQPSEDDIKKTKKNIELYNNKIKKIEENKIKDYEKELNNEKIKEKGRIMKIIKNNEINKEKDLQILNQNYQKDIKEIKRKYEEELKLRKIEYDKENKNINQKYLKIYNEETKKNEKKIKELNERYIYNINNIKNEKQIKDLINIMNLKKIIINTYNSCKNNYFYSINVLNIDNDYSSKSEALYDYKIVKLLGEGGFGIVYLVEKDNKKYALKHSKLKLTKEEKENIKNLINVISKINNEKIIKYYSSFEDNDSLNILMEYAGDCNLKQYINNYKNKNQLINESIILNIIIQICIGLKVIHENKIIHGDLTPDNIFIDKNNKIKIGDFGISKILAENNKYIKNRVGKSHYFAPEIDIGEKYDYRVDIYSLGCIIYELFTLNEYYIDKKIEEKDCKIAKDIYNPKSQELIDKLLKKDYHERPNIKEIINIIECIKNEINDNISSEFQKNVILDESTNLIEEGYDKKDNKNYITAKINIEEKDLYKDIRIINSFEENKRYLWLALHFFPEDKEYKDNEIYHFKNDNAKEIIDNCKIKINNEDIKFNYFHKIKKKGKYNIKYIFKNNITKTNYLFCGCESIIEIDLSNFNTKNITNMSYMFYKCKALPNINLSNFNAPLVSDMSYMFYKCKALTNINLSNFNAPKVSDISYMFCRCESLININLSNFSATNLSNISNIFSGCKLLTKVDFSNFNTEKVKHMRGIFHNCESLKYINLSDFNTKNVIDMSYFFDGCKSLEKIDLSNFDTQNVIDMSYMFYDCCSLVNLDLSNFNTLNAIYMSRMFSWCDKLENLNLSNFNTLYLNNVDISDMFYWCTSLKKEKVITNDRNILNKLKYK